MNDWKQNLPHILALIVLLFALLLVLTKVGLLGCGTLGASYCNIYYSIFGKPKVMLVYGSSGMGDPTELSRYLEDVKRLNVREVSMDQISAGMLDKYDIVIVEKARDIPTEKLRYFYDYVMSGTGRLVWVGDSGIGGGTRDSVCRDVMYTVKYTTQEGTKEVEDKDTVCVDMSESKYSSDLAIQVTNELYADAWDKLVSVCKDGFSGELQTVRTTEGYHCYNTDSRYSNVYITWDNEDDFKQMVNPWDRGEFKLIGGGESKGVNFGNDILGITFVSDSHAVSTYQSISGEFALIKNKLSLAHSALVTCSENFSPSGCDKSVLQAKVSSSLDEFNSDVSAAKVGVTSDISTLSTIEDEKRLNGNISQADRIASLVNTLTDFKSALQTASPETLNLTLVDNAISQLLTIKGFEEDQTHITQYQNILSHLNSYKSSLSDSISKYSDLKAQLGSCQEASGFIDEYASATGVNKSDLKSLFSLTYSPTDEAVYGFIISAARYTSIEGKLRSDSFCPNASEYLADAINTAENTEVASNASAFAYFRVEDEEHPLVEGITKSTPLVDKYGNPVPFVLVASNGQYSHVVASLKIQPAYKGEPNWPAITVRDPKYGSHIFGRGVVVYYAFPPETDEIFMDNLVNFMLY